ncbi:unnamed protein product [Closterium sp. NIES-54]
MLQTYFIHLPSSPNPYSLSPSLYPRSSRIWDVSDFITSSPISSLLAPLPGGASGSSAGSTWPHAQPQGRHRHH